MKNQKGIVHIVLILFLLVGLIAGVYLATNPKLFQTKSKASNSQILETLEFKTAQGAEIKCDANTTPPTCYTNSLDINVRVKNPNALIP